MSQQQAEAKRVLAQVQEEHLSYRARQCLVLEQQTEAGRACKQMLNNELTAAKSKHTEAQAMVQQLQERMEALREHQERTLAEVGQREGVIAELRLASAQLGERMELLEMDRRGYKETEATTQKKLKLEKERSQSLQER